MRSLEILRIPALVWLQIGFDTVVAVVYVWGLQLWRRRRERPRHWLSAWSPAVIAACAAIGSLLPMLSDASQTVAVVACVVMLVSLARRARANQIQAASEALTSSDALELRVRERTAELNRELGQQSVERQRVASALRASESRFRRLSESGIIGILTADLQGNIVDANDTFLNMLGYTPDDLAEGRVRWTELTPKEWSDSDVSAVAQLESRGVVPAWEKEYIHKDGRRVPVLIGAAMLEGAAARCICFTLDLTYRKRAQEAVEQMRAQHALDDRFRVLLDMAPDAMIVSGEDTRIGFANLQAERLFGYTRAELIGQPLDMLIPSRFRTAHAGHLHRFFRHPSARPMGSGVELFGLHKDGTELPIEVSLSPLQTKDGMTVSAAVRDISERKRLEAASKLLAERLRSAVDSIQDAFALFDDQDRLVLCNGVYRALIGDGITGSLVGRPYKELLVAWMDKIAFDSAADQSLFQQARLGDRRQLSTNAFDLRLKDGRSLRVMDRLTAEGGIVKTIWDLTDDVRLAEELRQARVAAEAASNAKTEFLSSMSHELRTPLNAVLGFAQLLQRDKKEPLSERHRERVGQIIRGGEHLLRLIDDILDLSRIEAGTVSLEIEAVAIGAALQHVKTTLEPLAARRALAVEIEPLPPDLPPIAADPTRFTQILMNFGSNAIKYNKPSGRVVFSVSAPRAECVRVIVRDTGLGIPIEQQNKLFQAFQRGGQEAGPIEGTGIGLFITKRLAELMHAIVGFSSTPGEGSEFWVEAPVYDVGLGSGASSTKTSVRPRHSTAVSGHRKILYVEDNPASIALMEDLIGGFEQLALIAAPTAELGIELARAHQPEIIIMDINLPGWSGLDALRELRTIPELQHIPVIALSAAASEQEHQRGLAAGFHTYLTKPLNVDAFIELLQQLLQ